MLIARIFPRPCRARKNTTQLAKYPHVLYAKPSNKVYLLNRHECFTGKYTTREIHKNYTRDPSDLFSIISHVSLSMT